MLIDTIICYFCTVIGLFESCVGRGLSGESEEIKRYIFVYHTSHAVMQMTMIIFKSLSSCSNEKNQGFGTC